MITTEPDVLYLEPEIAALLAQLLPEVGGHSQYVADLVRATAHQAILEPADGSAGLLYALASEDILAQDWLGLEEDEARRDLQSAIIS